MHAIRAIPASPGTGSITVHRRSKFALAVLGAVMAAAIVPGIATANQGPQPKVYLAELQHDLTIEYPGHGALVGSQPILDGYQRRLAIEYPSVSASQAFRSAVLDELQQHLAIEYLGDATPGHGSATHYGPPGR